MAALIAENFRFLSLFFKSKDVMIFNGLVALGTVGSEELFSVVAFHCPCSPARNYIYGLAAIGVPALALFLIGVIWNNHTWNLVAECHKRGTKNFSAAATFLLFGSIMGRASVAPITWSVISLLRGEAYICALSEFVKSSSLDKFPAEYGAEVLAKIPCRDVPANLTKFRDEVTRRLRYESQVGTAGRSHREWVRQPCRVLTQPLSSLPALRLAAHRHRCGADFPHQVPEALLLAAELPAGGLLGPVPLQRGQALPTHGRGSLQDPGSQERETILWLCGTGQGGEGAGAGVPGGGRPAEPPVECHHRCLHLPREQGLPALQPPPQVGQRGGRERANPRRP
ncbi:calcium homeostasis modulator protein 2 isoform X1 [Melospiza melodia melodia]|uniref:calcium homeostasis modulator protein 2 isoform X1 n=1 Tax=Melospiza melodia melodia TaxID=1914991 RepID=UPI002FD2C3F0